MQKTDHDILIEVATDMKYLKTFVEKNTKAVIATNDRVNKVEDWQQDFNSKTKVFLGMASLIGAVVTFIGEKLWDYFIQRG